MSCSLKIPLLLSAFSLCFLAFTVTATTYYVDVKSANPTPPYADWSTASTDIQDAVDIASSGDLVLVTNGVYQTTAGRMTSDGASNVVVITNALTLRSVNGFATTFIDGGAQMRCVYLTNNAVLEGFTITNGNARSARLGEGGGVYCASTNALVFNSLVISNTGYYGGGVYGGTVGNCTLSYNNATGQSGGGAGICTLKHCIICYNSAYNFGGGASFATLNNCIVFGNSARMRGGGVFGSTLNNCIIVSNVCMVGTGGGTDGCALNNCTVVGNYALQTGGVSAGLLMTFYSVDNSIIFYNSDADSGLTNDPYANFDFRSTMTNCCTPRIFSEPGCFTNAPLFVNLTNDFHLQSNSPCINAGNNVWITNTTDFDGNLRIVGGTVDVGAYEYQTPTSVISYAYLQQYDLPTDGSVDYVDLDGTGFNVYQDWITGLNPTNSTSVLAMLPLSKNSSGVTISWQSVTNIVYNLQRSTNLSAPSSFSTIQANIAGNAGTTTYLDTSATNDFPYFYRIAVP